MTEQTKVLRYIVGPVCTNCYLLVNEARQELLVIDPGEQAELLIRQIDQTQAKPVAILLTHGHFDHVMAVEEIKAHYDIPVYAHEAERQTLEDPERNQCRMVGVRQQYHADRYLKNEEVVELADFTIRVFHTPGHTPGGVCYYLEEQKLLFSGDTLFQESVGRTDFPGGSMSELIRSIQEKLMPLPDDVTVYTGHGESTLIGYERMHNPYL